MTQEQKQQIVERLNVIENSVEQLQAENVMLKKVLDLVISNHSIDSETAETKLQRYINFVKEESENERNNNYKNSNSERNS